MAEQSRRSDLIPLAGLWAALACLAGISWIHTVRGADGMRYMLGSMGMCALQFTWMWTVMMAAMMLPAVMPVATLYVRILGRHTNGLTRVLRTLALVSGYLCVWGALGLLAFGFAEFISRIMATSVETLLWVTGLVLFLGGAYELSPAKDRCLTHCRSPLDLLMRFGGYSGRLRDFQAGLYHAAYCVGCCAGLMLVMLMVGVMNVIWMGVLTVVILIQKYWRHGRAFARCFGAALMLTGIAVPLRPELLDLLYMGSALR